VEAEIERDGEVSHRVAWLEAPIAQVSLQ